MPVPPYISFIPKNLIGCTEGEVRLVGGTSNAEGRVEICLRNEWGTVCDQMWDVIDARVACRQLGLASTGSHRNLQLLLLKIPIMTTAASIQAVFGEGTGRIWLDSVQCTGSERALINCTARFNGSNSCTHAKDAGVRCLLGMLIPGTRASI